MTTPSPSKFVPQSRSEWRLKTSSYEVEERLSAAFESCLTEAAASDDPEEISDREVRAFLLSFPQHVTVPMADVVWACTDQFLEETYGIVRDV